mmetsp:Transcript_86761/g.165808  ORF Transcript_86761/g.165808 Transcript_86761/m.165808 type:complete len:734 (-) Transcript_86761:120-2321(-)
MAPPERAFSESTLLPAITARTVEILPRPPKLPLRSLAGFQKERSSTSGAGKPSPKGISEVSQSRRSTTGSAVVAAGAAIIGEVVGDGVVSSASGCGSFSPDSSAMPHHRQEELLAVSGARLFHSIEAPHQAGQTSPCPSLEALEALSDMDLADLAPIFSPPSLRSKAEAKQPLREQARPSSSAQMDKALQDRIQTPEHHPEVPRSAREPPVRRRSSGLGRKKRASSSGEKRSARKSETKRDPSTNAARQSKLCYVVQFGNNSPLVRQILRNRPGWAAGPGDPSNLVGKTSYDQRKVQVNIADDFPEIQFFWTQWSHQDIFDAMANQQFGLCVALNEETRMTMKLKKIPPEPPLAPCARVYNHFEGNGLLCTKCGLCEVMTEYYMAHNRDPFGALPLTFVVRQGSSDEQFAEWRRAYDAIEAESGQKIWLVKPGEWANRGCGIRIYDDANEVQERVDSKEKCWVLQKYLEQPLLIHRRKFDIRSYCLVTQEPGTGTLRAYFYKDAYLRTISAEYTTKSLDRMTHLNNDAVQKKGEDYGKFENANKLSLDDFQRYLDEHHGKGAVSVQEHIVKQIKGLMADCVRAVASRLNPRQIEHCFEVFGFDFMVDSSYRVWLIEVNVNPCLELCCPLLTVLIPRMLDEALRLTLDNIFPHAASVPAPPLDAPGDTPERRRGSGRSARVGHSTATGWQQIVNTAEPESPEVSSWWVPPLPDGWDKAGVHSLGRSTLKKSSAS